MDYVTVKCYAETRRLLRRIAAETGEQMVQVMDRLCRDEWARIAPRETRNVAANVAEPKTDPPETAP